MSTDLQIPLILNKEIHSYSKYRLSFFYIHIKLYLSCYIKQRDHKQQHLVPGLNPRCLFCVESLWFPRTVHRHEVRLIDNTKLPVGVNVSVVCLCLAALTQTDDLTAGIGISTLNITGGKKHYSEKLSKYNLVKDTSRSNSPSCSWSLGHSNPFFLFYYLCLFLSKWLTTHSLFQRFPWKSNTRVFSGRNMATNTIAFTFCTQRAFQLHTNRPRAERAAIETFTSPVLKNANRTEKGSYLTKE